MPPDAPSPTPAHADPPDDPASPSAPWRPDDVARFLAVSRREVYRLCEAEGLPHYELRRGVKRSRRFAPAEVRAWFAARARLRVARPPAPETATATEAAAAARQGKAAASGWRARIKGKGQGGR